MKTRWIVLALLVGVALLKVLVPRESPEPPPATRLHVPTAIVNPQSSNALPQQAASASIPSPPEPLPLEVSHIAAGSPPSESANPQITEAATSASTVPTPEPSTSASTPPSTLAPRPSDPLPELTAVKTLIRDYRLALGENPVGNNAEITSALNGANPKSIRFLVEGESTLNENEELVDHWNTPFFFHQLSAEKMEIRSAGPDRQLWTSDDLEVH